MQRPRKIFDFACLFCGEWIRGQPIVELIDRSYPLSTDRGPHSLLIVR